jgi:transcriptional regulator with PAS, ATPase and Fis domain
MYLAEIRGTASKFAKTISNILDIDVMIVDDNYNRIANTFRYSSEPLPVNRFSMLGEVIHTGKVVAVKDKNTYKHCKNCPDLNECGISGLVGVPIFYENKVIGAIALLVPLNKTSPALDNMEHSVDFLIRMADLLSSKLKNIDDYNKLNVIKKEREILLNNIEDGLVSVSNSGEILHYNQQFEELFGIGRDIKGENIETLIDHPLIHEIMVFKKNVSYKRFYYEHKKHSFNGLVSYENIVTNGITNGALLTFKSYGKVYNLINEVSENFGYVSFDDILGEDEKLIEEINRAKQLAVTDEDILIYSEPGLQETILARSIHNFSDRAKRNFVCIDCSSIPYDLMEKEIFGDERGTDYSGYSIGKLRIADGGTIFFKNISSMPLYLQMEIVEVIKNNKLEQGFNIDVKMIFYSPVDLASLVEQGLFSEELYYRISKNTITIPPLANRKDDIKLIIDKTIKKMKIKHGKPGVTFEKDVLDMMYRYNWPKNLQEIEMTIDRIIYNLTNKDVAIKDIKDYKFTNETSTNIITLDEMEKELIKKALLQYDNKDQVAEALGIGRATLYRKLKKYDIN